MMTAPMCRDCKWIERWVPVFWNLRRCLHPNATISHLDGKKEFASIRRLNGSLGDDTQCGFYGRDWEPR